MQIFGSFQATSELHRTGLGSVLAAVRVDPAKPDVAEKLKSPADAPFAVKVCQPDADLVGTEAAKTLRDTFLERADVHRKAAINTSNHWAPIHDLGQTSDGAAYVVTDQFQRTAQKLIAGRVKLNDDALFNVVNSVLAGLLELSTTQGRAHGNLKPSNVLIGPGDLKNAPVYLSDPGSIGDVLMRGGEAADLHAVGELIHQLVTFRPADPHIGTIAKTSDWGRLGGSNRGWRELCTKLLNPDGDSFTLAEAQKQLKSVRSRSRMLIGGLITAAIALVIIGVGSTSIFYSGLQTQWKTLTGNYDGWFGQLATHARDTSVRDKWSADPSLAKIIQTLDGAEHSMIDLKPTAILGKAASSASEDLTSPAHAPLSLDVLAKTKAANAEIQTVRAQLSPGQWMMLADYTKRQQADAVKGLDAPAKFLAALLGDIRTEPFSADKPNDHGTAMVTAIDNLLTLKTSGGERDLSDLESLATELKSQEQTLSKEPQLQQFADRCKSVADATLADSKVKKDRGLSALLDKLRSATEQGRELSKFVATEWNIEGRYDQARFHADYKPGNLADESAAHDWLRAAHSYQIDSAARDQKLAVIDVAKKDAAAQIKKLREINPADTVMSTQFEQTLAAIDPRIAALSSRNWIAQDANEHAGDDVVKDLATLNGEIGRAIGTFAGKPEDWLAASAQIKASQEELRAAYLKKFSQLLNGRSAELLRADPAQFVALKSTVDAWQAAYAELSKKLPASSLAVSKDGDAGLSTEFAAAANARYAALIEGSINSGIIVDAKGLPTVDGVKVSALLSDYDSWSKSLATLAAGARAATAVFDDGGGLNDTIGDGPSPAAWEKSWQQATAIAADPPCAAAVAPLLQRIEKLRNAESMTSGDCGQVLESGSATPELRVAALRLLLTASSTIPTTLREFTGENATRGSLDVYLQNNVRSISRRQAIRNELLTPGPQRWTQFVNNLPLNASTDDCLGRASDAMSTFGVSDYSTLTPRARFNMLLRNFRSNVGRTEDDAKTLSLFNAFVTEISALPKEGTDLAALSSVVKALTRYRQPIIDGPKGAWQLTPGGDDRIRRYTRTVDQDAKRTIEFVRVDRDDLVPFYICTTELPLELFVDEANVNPNVRKTLTSFDDRTDTRQGPRVWRWTAGGGAVGRPLVWLPETLAGNGDLGDKGYYADGIGDPRYRAGLKNRDDEPSPRHPLQQISPKTARALADAFGCRLPSATEWAATYDAFGKGVTDRNVRDRTWAQQLQYVNALPSGETLRAMLRPSAGTFVKSGDKPTLTNINIDDGTLWFRKVDSGGGQPIHHLAGNVAEYVLDLPGDHFSVIGGSALSMPETQIDQPQAIDAARLDQGYSDVGLRLAFTAKISDAQRLRKAIANQPYMAPAK